MKFPKNGCAHLAAGAVCLLLALLIACAMPVKVSDGTARTSSESIRYGKDPRTGLCFAFLGSRSADSYTIVSLATVPCEQVPQELLK